ncbi:MAG: aspartate aminotransferase family protein [Xanthobacteraceae bacterium]|nr:aspartate aminotransferase family protein [Xanthobacteraceae bacterium]QYK45341.1 MAG: aspartate aminotransferase family protein [Xanthobacteraceae bacterium]
MTIVAISPVLPTYSRAEISFERGEGAWLTATDGRKFLDFGSGVAVNALGHAHPALVKAISEQAQKLWHVSNLYRIPEGERLAKRLVENTFADTCFFQNSGAEAMECSIKMARKYHAVSGHPERYQIITFDGAFHGRTLATIAATGNEKYLEGFGPRMPGFVQVKFGDLDAVKKAITNETAAILIEPVQGEGGVRVPPPGFIKALRELCDTHGLLLMFDEVQTGVGRTGKFFAYEWTGVTPDIMAVAKGIGGGFPLGICLATAEAGKGMTPGTHGSTFGGNPLAMAVANAVLDQVLAPGFLDHVQKMALFAKQRLAELKDTHKAIIAEVRGEGLLLGLKTVVPNGEFVTVSIGEGLLTVAAGENVVRLLPPLIVTEIEINEAISKLSAACRKLEAATTKGAA